MDLGISHGPLEKHNEPLDFIKSNFIVEPESLRPDFEELISYGPYGVTLVVSGEKIVPTYIGIFEPFYHGKVCQT